MFLELKKEQLGPIPRYENGRLPEPEGGAVNYAFLVHPDLADLRIMKPNDPTVERNIVRAEAFYAKRHRPGGFAHDLFKMQGVEIIGLLKHETNCFEGRLIHGECPRRRRRVSYGALIHVPYFSDSFRFAMTEPGDERYDDKFKADAISLKREIFSKGLIPALKLAHEIGAGFVGYGKLTSSLTNNGQDLDDLGIVHGTSGNSLTAWALFQSTIRVFRKLMPVKLLLRTGTLLFIGSTGAVGRPACELLAPYFARGMIILGCQDAPASIARAERMKRILVKQYRIDAKRVLVRSDINAVLPYTDVNAVATSAVGTSECPIDWTRAKPGSCLCEISRPSALSEGAGAVEHFLAFDGSYVTMPGGFIDSSYLIYGIDRTDLTLACLAETAGAALSGATLSQSIGTDRSAVLAKEIFVQQKKLGFYVGKPRWEGKVIPKFRYEQVREAGEKHEHEKKAKSSIILPLDPLGQSAY